MHSAAGTSGSSQTLLSLGRSSTRPAGLIKPCLHQASRHSKPCVAVRCQDGVALHTRSSNSSRGSSGSNISSGSNSCSSSSTLSRCKSLQTDRQQGAGRASLDKTPTYSSQLRLFLVFRCLDLDEGRVGRPISSGSRHSAN